MASIFRQLIFPKLVAIARLDTVATAAAGGYVGKRRDVSVVNANDDTPRTTGRTETIVRLPAQIEMGVDEDAAPTPLGNAPRSRRVLVFSADDLEDLGLVQDGRCLLKVQDRLHAVYDIETEALVELIPDPPGLYCQHANPRGEDMGPGGWNLFEMVFEDRAKGPRNT
ncbi:MAG: hypothetical protein EKK55_25005 [Rhodocyclaceae bacterium]|nr:MAG: hypothetical protein EKK55_25005 [Rhodocyclaceae bacterium]